MKYEKKLILFVIALIVTLLFEAFSHPRFAGYRELLAVLKLAAIFLLLLSGVWGTVSALKQVSALMPPGLVSRLFSHLIFIFTSALLALFVVFQNQWWLNIVVFATIVQFGFAYYLLVYTPEKRRGYSHFAIATLQMGISSFAFL